MKILRRMFMQYAHPRGFWGRIVAWRLNLSNQAVNDWTLALLDLQPNDRVLEIGFGSGLTLQKAAQLVPQGFLAGVDSSGTMLEMARKRNAAVISTGRMELKAGEMERLPYADRCFNKAYAVQVLPYLPDPILALAELHRVLQPGGRAVLFYEPKDKFVRFEALVEGIYRLYTAEEGVGLLKQAGFNQVRAVVKEFVVRGFHYKGICILGEVDEYSVSN